MSANWPEFQLAERCKVQSSKRIFAKEYVDDGVPFFRSKDVIDKSLGQFENYDLFISRARYLEIKEKHGSPQKGDLLISSVGNRSGQPYIVQDEGDFYFKDGNILWMNEFDGLNPKFLAYWFKSDLGQSALASIMIGSAQKALTIDAVRKLWLRFPEQGYQDKAVTILEDLDSKIETNRQINQTLEQIAHAIFKSWFVDFEPVKAKIAAREALLASYAAKMPTATAAQIAQAPSPQEIEKVERQAAIKAISDVGDVVPTEQLQILADLFPNQLVESELGEIPEGWEGKSFGDVSTCFDSKRVPLSKKKREEKKPGDIPYYGATSVMDYVNEWIFDDIYLLLGEDGSVVKEDGSPFVQYIWGKSWVNNHAHVLQGKAGVSTEQLMLFMQSQNIASFVTGAVQLKLNQKNMNSIPFVDAGTALNNSFYQIVAPLYAAIRNNTDENEVLSQTRDILLPKLLSGEIELTNKELLK